ITELRTQVIHYAKTREVYASYRKTGYSKKFRAEHEADILLHQAAKEFFDKQGIKKLPKVKELNAEYTELLKQKKAVYPEYRKAREEMQRLLRAQKNIERFFADETPQPDRQQSRYMKHAKGRFCVGLWRAFLLIRRIEAFRRNAQPASTGCSLERVWEVPNKHFCAGPEGHDAKNATWYQVAL